MVLSHSSAVLMVSGSSCRLWKWGDLRLPGVCDILDKQLNKIAKNCMEERSAWNLLGHSLLLNVSKTQRFRWVESLERQVGDAAETRLGGGGTVCVMTEQLFPC